MVTHKPKPILKSQRQSQPTFQRYHYTKLPKFTPPTGIFELEYTKHAREAATTDRYGYIDLSRFPYLNVDKARLVEIDVNPETNSIIKILYSVRYSSEYDLKLAVVPMGRVFRVKSLWLNETHDTHKTLRWENYTIPAKMYHIDQLVKQA